MKLKPVTGKLSEEEIAELHALAEREQRTVSWMIRRAVRAMLASDKEKGVAA